MKLLHYSQFAVFLFLCHLPNVLGFSRYQSNDFARFADYSYEPEELSFSADEFQDTLTYNTNDEVRIPSFQASKNQRGGAVLTTNRFAALAEPPKQGRKKSGGGGRAPPPPGPSPSGGQSSSSRSGGNGRQGGNGGQSSSSGSGGNGRQGGSGAPPASSASARRSRAPQGSPPPGPSAPVSPPIGPSPPGPSLLRKAGTAIASAGAVGANLVSNNAERVGKIADATGDSTNLASMALHKTGLANPNSDNPMVSLAPMGKHFVMAPPGGLAIPAQPNNPPSAPTRPDGKALRNRVNQRPLPPLQEQGIATSAPDTRIVDQGLGIGEKVATGLSLAGHAANVVSVGSKMASGQAERHDKASGLGSLASGAGILMGNDNLKNTGTVVAAVSTVMNPESRDNIMTHAVGVKDNAQQLVRGTFDSLKRCVGAICNRDVREFGQAAKDGVVNGVSSSLNIGRHAIKGLGEAAPLLEAGAVGLEAGGYPGVALGVNAIAGASRLGKAGLEMAGLYDEDEDELDSRFELDDEDSLDWYNDEE